MSRKMSSLRQLDLTYPHQIWLELSEEMQLYAWNLSQKHSNFISQYTVYLNQLCLSTVKPWLEGWFEEEQVEKNSKLSRKLRVFKESNLPAIWDVLNGTAMDIDETRLVFIPTESRENWELCVPREWVDIPSWRGDYYFVVHLNVDSLEASWIRICGWIAYDKLKHKGEYEECDRAYYINPQDLTEDATQLLQNPQPITHRTPQMQPTPQTFSPDWEKIANAALNFPRLVLPNEQWTVLLTDDNLRQELYQRRLGLKSEPKAIAAATIDRKRTTSQSHSSARQPLEILPRIQEMLTSICTQVEALTKPSSEQLIPGYRSSPVAPIGYKGTIFVAVKSSTAQQKIALTVALVPSEHQSGVLNVFVGICPVEEPTLLPNLELAALSLSRVTLIAAQAEEGKPRMTCRFSRSLNEPFFVRLSFNDWEHIQLYSSALDPQSLI